MSYTIMHSRTCMPLNCFAMEKYRKVAVLQIDEGFAAPKTIRNTNHARIVWLRDRLFAGRSSKCAFQKALVDAAEFVARVEGRQARKEAVA